MFFISRCIFGHLAKVVNLTSCTTGQFLLMSRKVISHLYSPSSVVRIGSMVSLASCATKNRRTYDIFDIDLRVQGKTAPLQELPLGLAEVDNRAVDEDSSVLFVPLDRVEVPATGSAITIV